MSIDVPGFRMIRQLGAGAFGSVWLAEQPSFDREVAIKIAHRPLADDSARLRFERECRAMGRLSGNANIVAVHVAGTLDDGRPYLVLEYISGGTLWDRVVDRALTTEQLRGFGHQIGDALASAHEFGILHRDIKPENVLLRRDDSAVLGDFGIAVLRDGALTASAAITASVPFAAPEVLMGRKANVLSDLYSLGATILASGTRSIPFVESADEGLPPVLNRVLSVEPATLASVGYPLELSDVVSRLMDKDPARRPQSAAEAAALFAGVDAAGGPDPTPDPGLTAALPANGLPPAHYLVSPPTPAADSGPVDVGPGTAETALPAAAPATGAGWVAPPAPPQNPPSAVPPNPPPSAYGVPSPASTPHPPAAAPSWPAGPPTPGALTPGAVTPGAVTPGAVTPGAAAPGAANPNAQNPNAPNPSNVDPASQTRLASARPQQPPLPPGTGDVPPGSGPAGSGSPPAGGNRSMLALGALVLVALVMAGAGLLLLRNDDAGTAAPNQLVETADGAGSDGSVGAAGGTSAPDDEPASNTTTPGEPGGGTDTTGSTTTETTVGSTVPELGPLFLPLDSQDANMPVGLQEIELANQAKDGFCGTEVDTDGLAEQQSSHFNDFNANDQLTQSVVRFETEEHAVAYVEAIVASTTCGAWDDVTIDNSATYSAEVGSLAPQQRFGDDTLAWQVDVVFENGFEVGQRIYLVRRFDRVLSVGVVSDEQARLDQVPELMGLMVDRLGYGP